MTKFKTIFKQVLPWVMTVAILYYVFRRQDYELIIRSFQGANLALFIPISVVLLIAGYLLDCLSQYYCLKWFCAPIPFRKVLVARGVSFLPMLINFNLGQAGMVYFFYRQTGKSLKSVAGAFAFTIHADLYAFTTLFTISLFFLRDQPELAGMLAPLCAASWAYWFGVYGYWRWGWHKRVFKSIYEWEIMNAFREARFRHYLAIYLLRAPLLFIINGLFYLALVSFRGHIPVVDFMVRMPIVLLIMGLPITVAGLGLTQVAWQMLFASYTGEALGVALTLASQFVMIVVNTAIALFCLPFGRDFFTALKQSRGEGEQGRRENMASPSREVLPD